MRIACKRFTGHYGHALHQFLRGVTWLWRRQDGSVATRLDREAQHRDRPVDLGLEFGSMVEIEVPHTRCVRHIHLTAIDVVLGSIHNRPDCLPIARPPARVNAVGMHWVERFPILADQETRNPALDGPHAPRRLSIPWRNAVP